MYGVNGCVGCVRVCMRTCVCVMPMDSTNLMLYRLIVAH